MIRSRSVIPALKDQVKHMGMGLGSNIPTAEKSVLFLNRFYDYQIVGMSAVVMVATATTASQFTIGYGAYTDIHGVLQPLNATAFLPQANCVDQNGNPFGSVALPPGTLVVFPIQPDPLGQGLNILRAGAPLTVTTVAGAGTTGTIVLSVTLRPKDKDRNDYSKTPGGSAYEGYGTYYK
jgi:hypothetical protein